MKNWSRALLGPLLALAASAAGCGSESSPVAVGILERDAYDLVSEVSEPVLRLPVEEGARVDAGAAVVLLDPARLETQRHAALARVAEAEATLADLERGTREERIAAAEARHAGTAAEVERAEREEARATSLTGAVAERAVDDARTALQEARAAEREAAATLADLRAGTRAEQLDRARAAVDAARAAVDEADLALERLTVRAPVAGTLESLPLHVGERPHAGGTVATLLAAGPPYARVFVPEAQRASLSVGDLVTVHVDGVDAPFPGRVRTIAKDASFTPYYALTEHDRGRLTYLAKIDLEGARATELPAGLPVQVELEARSSDGR